MHFYPRPPRGGRRVPAGIVVIASDFYPRPPRGGRLPQSPCYPRRDDFYPRPPRGGRLPFKNFVEGEYNFYPRPPRGGRQGRYVVRSRPADFYPRPPRGGRPGRLFAVCEGFQFLSTPSARRATKNFWRYRQTCTISIHALREEGDKSAFGHTLAMTKFLSTPSARRATGTRRQMVPRPSNFYPRPPRGGRPFHFAPDARPPKNFYPRPPRGGRLAASVLMVAVIKFLSTPSARRATRSGSLYLTTSRISIHALREEGDVRSTVATYAGVHDFYPRPPRGGRQQKQRQNLYFQTNYTTFCTNLEEP